MAGAGPIEVSKNGTRNEEGGVGWKNELKSEKGKEKQCGSILMGMGVGGGDEDSKGERRKKKGAKE